VNSCYMAKQEWFELSPLTTLEPSSVTVLCERNAAPLFSDVAFGLRLIPADMHLSATLWTLHPLNNLHCHQKYPVVIRSSSTKQRRRQFYHQDVAGDVDADPKKRSCQAVGRPL
jgi:hypothetical protein